MATEQREQEVVRGTVQSVVTKGPDKWQVVVMPQGSQYTKNLWTKDGALANDMVQRINQAFDFLCNVSHWTNQSGQPVRSLWVESLGYFGSIPDPAPVAAPPQQAYQQPQQYQQPQPQQAWGQQAPTTQPPPQQHRPPGVPMGQAMAPQPASGPQAQPQTPQGALAPQGIPPEVKEMRIMRQTASKVAAIMLPYLPESERNLDGFMEMAEFFVRYYAGGPQQPRPQSQQALPQPPMNGPQAQGDPAYAAADPGREQGDPGPDYYTGGFPQ